MMNTTSNSPENPDDCPLGNETIGGFGYGLGLSIAVLIIFVVVTYASYKCKRPPIQQSRPITALHHRRSSSASDDDLAAFRNNGLDQATISSYPHYEYSQLKPHKNDSTCSICLADYKDRDSLRLLPDCGHIFHLKCVDSWLMIHPTCPVCRNSPLPTPLRDHRIINIIPQG